MQSYIRHIIKGILLMLSLIVLPLHSTAQQSKCTISGHITDAQNAPIAYASVAVYDDTKAIAGTITDDNGKFMLKVPVSTDGYEMAVEFIGYTRHTCTIGANKSNIVLSTIVLKEDTIALEGATVTAKEATQKSTVEHTTIMLQRIWHLIKVRQSIFFAVRLRLPFPTTKSLSEVIPTYLS